MEDLIKKRLPSVGSEISNEKGELKKVQETYFKAESNQYMVKFEDGSEMPANKVRILKTT